jgi:hypothetical protein
MKRSAAETGYKEHYAERAFKLCLLGLKDDEIAASFDISPRTLANWKDRHPEFMQALKKGKEQADADIANSLYHRAKGYSKKVIEPVVTKDGVIEIEKTIYYPPDTTAIIYWLKNRQPHKWRDKREIEGDIKHDIDPKQFIQNLLK